MLLVNVHKLDIVLADAVILGVLKDDIDHVGGVFGLDGENVGSRSGAKNFLKGPQIDANGNISVTSEGRECSGGEEHAD